MSPTREKQLPVLDYTTAAQSPGWPIGIYCGALFWAFVTLRLFTWRLPKRPSDAQLNRFALRVQLVFLTLAAVRLAWAVARKDKTRAWLLYVVLLILAAPLWRLLEHIGYRLAE